MRKKEFKVVKAEHSRSNLKDGSAYAVVASTYLVAEPDSVRGVYLDREDDMFIIAPNFEEAINMLNKHLTDTIGRI